MNYANDSRIVMTLDAGGTNFVFSAIKSNIEIVEPITKPSNGNNLDLCLKTIVYGFTEVQNNLSELPVAISFAFPGPSDFPNGIIGDLANLPCFRGGVALGPMLKRKFNIPVFINNDGDLFVYGEAIAGFLPEINKKLADAKSHKRYLNLIGVTLGTGFGGGIVRNGELYIGDNSAGAEIWSSRNKRYPKSFAEEGASIRGVQKAYAKRVNIPYTKAPSPKDIYEIAVGRQNGTTLAAKEAFMEMAEIVGDAIANATILLDGLIVIGGGLSGAAEIFLQRIVDELNTKMESYEGKLVDRMESKAFNLEDEAQLSAFIKGEAKQITIPGTNEKIPYDPLKRVGVGISRLGTSKATAIGAYTFALNELDHQ